MNPELQALLLSVWQVLQWPLILLASGLGVLLLHRLVTYLDALASKAKLDSWYAVAYMLVTAAEQSLPPNADSDKYDWVRTALKTYFPALTEEQVKQLIESAVLEMHNALKSIPAPATGAQLVVAAVPSGQPHS